MGRRGLTLRHQFTWSHFRLADKCGAFFDDDARGAEIAGELGAGFEFASLGHGDVARNGSVNGCRLGANFALDLRIFSESKRALGDDFAFDFAVENQLVVEFDGSLDVNVIRQDVFGGRDGRFGHEIRQIVEVHTDGWGNLARALTRSNKNHAEEVRDSEAHINSSAG